MPSADGDRVGDHERPDVSRGRPTSGRRPCRRPSGPGGWHMTAAPVTNIASVASMSGAPRIAPTPMPCECGLLPKSDGDDRDHRLGQRRPDRGEDRADRALGQVQLPAEPLDPVREKLGADQDEDERDEEERQLHVSRPQCRERSLARSRTGSASTTIHHLALPVTGVADERHRDPSGRGRHDHERARATGSLPVGGRGGPRRVRPRSRPGA